MHFDLPFLLIIGFFASFALVLVAVPIVRRFAIAIDFVDEPGGRKTHKEAIPPIGGIVIFPVFILVGFAVGVDLSAIWPFFLGISILLMIGALDDRCHISAWKKFSAQIFVSFLVVLTGGAHLHHLGDLFGFGNFGLGYMSIPFSVAAVALLINAINLMDGLDGLAGGTSFVVLFWVVMAYFGAGHLEQLLPLLPLFGALLGFLFYNMRHPLRERASVFLGDAGSLCLGLSLAWFCIGSATNPDPVLAPISVAWILALPIVDTCAQFYRRVKEGRHPFSPDRGHFHHHFIHAGLSMGRSTIIILMLGMIFGAIGYVPVKFGVPEFVLTFAWMAFLFAHMGVSRDPKRYTNIVAKATRCKNQ